MKKIIYKIVLACALLFVASCGSLPKKNEIRVDDQPTLFIIDGQDAQVYVDGILLGVVEDNDQVFPVSTGSHNVRIVKANGQVVERSIFVQGNTRREINVAN
ncbi:MAG: hypothetical protein HOI58_12380 [Kordiimonadaceae bacterium]|nr:hypothetical protein [Kordiimonadaceae bacterium]